jgi:integrase/recombinase XerD
MTLLAPLITGFLRDYMPRQRGYSSHSCEAYAYSFRLLFTFAAKRIGTRPSQLLIEQLDAPLILDFLGHIERERGNGVATRNLRLAAIKTFMRYVEYQVPSALEQIGQIHAIPVKRHDQKLIRHLVMVEVRAILNAPDLTTRLGVRDRAMMHLCFAAGLRVSELVGAMMANLSLQRPPSLLVLGKGRKERCLPLWKETAADLRAWLTLRGSVRVPELFVNAEGAPMARAGFEYVLEKHARAAAETCPSLRDRSISPHQLRHTVVRPETLVRWHRAGFRCYWHWKSRPCSGRRWRAGRCRASGGSWVRSLSPPPSSLRKPPFPQSTPNRALLRGSPGHLLAGLWSLRAFALFRDDFWRPVSASKNSVPNSEAEREVGPHCARNSDFWAAVIGIFDRRGSYSGLRPSASNCRPHSVGGSRSRSMPMPRGRRPSTAALMRLGARKASEIVILTCRALHFSRV